MRAGCDNPGCQPATLPPAVDGDLCASPGMALGLPALGSSLAVAGWPFLFYRSWLGGHRMGTCSAGPWPVRAEVGLRVILRPTVEDLRKRRGLCASCGQVFL